MALTFDFAKSERNRRERQLPFEAAEAFDWSRALIIPDERRPYPEPRFRATSLLWNELHMLVFTPTSNGIRITSLRTASRKERRQWLDCQTHT